MKKLLFCLFASLSLNTFAQSIEKPKAVLKEEGRDTTDIVPQGWNIMGSAIGDVNNDGLKDLVLLVLPDYEDQIIIRDMDNYKFNCNEPIAAIYFGQANNTYKLFRQATNIVPAGSDTFFIEDSQVSVNEKGVITFGYQTFSSMGSWTNDNNKFIYRYQNGDIYLIGKEIGSLDRHDQSTTNDSYNFLTHKKLTTTTLENGKTKKRWTNLKSSPLKTFGEDPEDYNE